MSRSTSASDSREATSRFERSLGSTESQFAQSHMGVDEAEASRDVGFGMNESSVDTSSHFLSDTILDNSAEIEDNLEPLISNIDSSISAIEQRRESRLDKQTEKLANDTAVYAIQSSSDSSNPGKRLENCSSIESDSIQVESQSITGDMVLFRQFTAHSVLFTPATETQEIIGIATPYDIDQTDQNQALQYVNGCWSSIQYISKFRIISFGGYDEATEIPHDKTVLFNLKNMKIARELSPMKMSRFSPVVTLVGESVYVFGGGFGKPIECTRVEAERFHIKSESWEDLPNMTYPKRTANPSDYQDVIYIVGGLGSPHNEAYRILQCDYIPLNTIYPDPLSVYQIGIRSISYIIDDELVLLNCNFLQVYSLAPTFAYKSSEKVEHTHLCLRSPVSPRVNGNLVYSTALCLDRARGERRNYFCIFDKDTRKFHLISSVELCPRVKPSLSQTIK